MPFGQLHRKRGLQGHLFQTSGALHPDCTGEVGHPVPLFMELFELHTIGTANCKESCFYFAGVDSGYNYTYLDLVIELECYATRHVSVCLFRTLNLGICRRYLVCFFFAEVVWRVRVSLFPIWFQPKVVEGDIKLMFD
jgi:hypothetical protein